jgi:hypothetical protein
VPDENPFADETETVVRLVAEGKLSPEEAERLLDALAEARRARERDRPPITAATSTPPGTDAGAEVPRARADRNLRIQVSDRGREVVNLRVPLGLAGSAAALVPGLPDHYLERIREALRAGVQGPILEVRDEDGGGVLISTE